MNCPYCNYNDTKVLDSRPTSGGKKIRRRRECISCRKKFTTFEQVETMPVMIIKKDNSREAFKREKLINGLLRACASRPVSVNDIERIADLIEQKLVNDMEKEYPSSIIGEYAMQELKKLDDVSYVRFASVYKQFKDINSFMEELKQLINN
ncbi:MAG: transcriptional regulator NrdR [Clostridia bacterium]|nr:transcriptional regulator NrdR [Clostridia bacterium]